MSKLGKKPIIIPKDTKIKLESGRLILTGPKGSKELTLNDKIFSATIADDKNLILKLINKNENFNAILKGNILELQIGFSHNVTYKIPEEIKVAVEKSNIVKISGIDKELVGKVSSEIKMLKPVEPYKGKGIKERGQYVLRKEGKKK